MSCENPSISIYHSFCFIFLGDSQQQILEFPMSSLHPPDISSTGKMLTHAIASAHPVSNMLNKLHGQPESYDKKSKYRFGRTLGAGTYGIVREADGPPGKVCRDSKFTRKTDCVLTLDSRLQ